MVPSCRRSEGERDVVYQLVKFHAKLDGGERGGEMIYSLIESLAEVDEERGAGEVAHEAWQTLSASV